MEQHCWLAVVVRNQSYSLFRLSKGNTAIVVSKVDSYCSPLALKIVKVQLCSLSLFEAIINLHPNANTQVHTNGDREYISGRKLVLRARWLVWGVLTSHYLGRRLVLHKRKRFLVFRPNRIFHTLSIYNTQLIIIISLKETSANEFHTLFPSRLHESSYLFLHEWLLLGVLNIDKCHYRAGIITIIGDNHKVLILRIVKKERIIQSYHKR